MKTRSYALRDPENGRFWRFMTTSLDWENASKGLPCQLWQSDTPVSLSREEAEATVYFQVHVIGADPLEIVEAEGPPTHRFADDPCPAGTFFPQLVRCRYRCPETTELFNENHHD